MLWLYRYVLKFTIIFVTYGITIYNSINIIILKYKEVLICLYNKKNEIPHVIDGGRNEAMLVARDESLATDVWAQVGERAQSRELVAQRRHVRRELVERRRLREVQLLLQLLLVLRLELDSWQYTSKSCTNSTCVQYILTITVYS